MSFFPLCFHDLLLSPLLLILHCKISPWYPLMVTSFLQGYHSLHHDHFLQFLSMSSLSWNLPVCLESLLNDVNISIPITDSSVNNFNYSWLEFHPTCHTFFMVNSLSKLSSLEDVFQTYYQEMRRQHNYTLHYFCLNWATRTMINHSSLWKSW